MRASNNLIEQFVQQKTYWILKTRKKIEDVTHSLPRQYLDGETFLFLGSLFDLKLVGLQKPSLQFDSGFTLSQAAQKKGGQLFVRWYKERASEIISDRVKEYARRHGFTPKQVKITSAKTRWGSCSPNGTLNFTWRLVMAPLEVIDYVVIHELAHLRVKNHSSKFWDEVQRIDPGYKEKRKWLRINGEKLNL